MTRWSSLLDLFYAQALRWQSRPLVYGKREHHWRPLTWSQVALRAKSIAAGLVFLGTQPQERVAIWSKSSPEWVLCDLGSLSAALVNVPIYEGCSNDELVYLLRDSQSVGVFIQGEGRLERLLSLVHLLPDLKWVVTLDDRGTPNLLEKKPISTTSASFLLSTFPLPFVREVDEPTEELDSISKIQTQIIPLSTLENFDELFEVFKDHQSDFFKDHQSDLQTSQVLADEVERRIKMLTHDDLLTLQYTSGTTGEPKGVMITHGNILVNCEGVIEAIPINPSDTLLSFLPLSHSLERLAGYYMPTLFGGAQIYFAEGLGRLIRNMHEVSPTIITGVPRIYEKIYARFRGRRGAQGMIQRGLTRWALHIEHKVSNAQKRGQTPSALIERQLHFARHQVFKELRSRLGGRIRFMVSGGTPLAVEVAEFFHAAGLLILEGYGLSETSPVLSVNRPHMYRFGSVGKPLYNVKVKCAVDGEILVQGGNLTRGYLHKSEETDALFTADRWLKTGDIGRFDSDGFLYITDRKKDLFKTANGKFIAPQYLERLLNSSPLIEQSYVVGDRRPYCVALIVPSELELQLWAESAGVELPSGGLESWVKSSEVIEQIWSEVIKLNKKLARHETIKQIHLCGASFAGGHLTTASLKLKRQAVMEVYHDDIDQLYQLTPVSAFNTKGRFKLWPVGKKTS